MNRRRLLLGAAACAALARPVAAPAQGFPSRPIRLVVAFPAGGPTDVVARGLAERMARELGQPMVVENRGGANGNISADHIAKSDPDGHAVLYTRIRRMKRRFVVRSREVLRRIQPLALHRVGRP